MYDSNIWVGNANHCTVKSKQHIEITDTQYDTEWVFGNISQHDILFNKIAAGESGGWRGFQSGVYSF